MTITLNDVLNAKVEILDGAGESYGYSYETLASSFKDNCDASIVDYFGDAFGGIREAIENYDNGENNNALFDGIGEIEYVEITDGIAFFLEDGIKLFSVVAN